MSAVMEVVALAVAVSLVGGLLRVLRGPTRADRLIAAQLLGTGGVGLLLLLAEAQGAGALRDVALVLAALSAVTTLAFVRLESPTRGEP